MGNRVVVQAAQRVQQQQQVRVSWPIRNEFLSVISSIPYETAAAGARSG